MTTRPALSCLIWGLPLLIWGCGHPSQQADDVLQKAPISQLTAAEMKTTRANWLAEYATLVRVSDNSLSHSIASCKSDASKELERDHLTSLAAEPLNEMVVARKTITLQQKQLGEDPNNIGSPPYVPVEICSFRQSITGERIVNLHKALCQFKKGAYDSVLVEEGVSVPERFVYLCDGLG